MPAYQYRCRACGATQTLTCAPEHESKARADSGGLHCPACFMPMRRVFGFSTPAMYHEHFNESVGKVVSSRRQFRDELKRKSDEATARTGIPHNFEPIDNRELAQHPERFGVGEEGLKSQHDTAVARGQKPPSSSPLSY